MGFFDSLTGANIGKATLNAIDNKRQLITDNENILKNTQGNLHLLNDVAENRSQLEIDRGIAGFNPWADTGRNANTMYSNALGLGGEAGNEAATGAFQAGPGYQFAMDQGTKAALRGASAGGLLASGNTLTALTQYGQGLADQEYGSWLDRLNGMSQTGLQAVGQQQQGYNAAAGMIQNSNANRLGVESGIQQGFMGLNTDRAGLEDETAAVKEQQAKNKGSFFGGLLKTGISLGTKALTGGLI